jgi:hypothetical protein
MLERALTAGVPAKWVTGDEVYGHDRKLRLWLESWPQAHVMAGLCRKFSFAGLLR